MGKRTLIGSILVLTLILLMPSIPAIQQNSIKISQKPIIFPIIRFESFISFEEDIVEVQSPISPGSHIVIPITFEYWTDIPKIFNYIPYQLNNLFLFYSFISPIQNIYFENLDNSSYIDIYFSQNPILIPIDYSVEKIKSSNNLIILVDENTPSDWYFFNIKAHCNDIGRVDGTNNIFSIAFFVDN